MIEITSFGYLHGEPPKADLVLDARHLIRDPHVDPALRELTGRDTEVIQAVMSTPGAEALADFICQAAIAADEGEDSWTRLAIGCQGGRHRSVVLADTVADTLGKDGLYVQIYHRDIDQPVVERKA